MDNYPDPDFNIWPLFWLLLVAGLFMSYPLIMATICFVILLATLCFW